MLPSHTITALLLATFGTIAWGPSGDAMADASPAKVRCEIRSQVVPGGVQLSALAVASTPVRGSYEVVVTKLDGAGSSKIAQSGEFTLEPGRQSTLGEVSLSLGRTGAYEADLTLTWPGGEVSCRRSHPQNM